MKKCWANRFKPLSPSAVQDQKLRVAGYPRFEGKPAEGDAFEFSATFEVYPEVVVGDLSARLKSSVRY